jgi:hypothetical protein
MLLCCPVAGYEGRVEGENPHISGPRNVRIVQPFFDRDWAVLLANEPWGGVEG